MLANRNRRTESLTQRASQTLLRSGPDMCVVCRGVFVFAVVAGVLSGCTPRRDWTHVGGPEEYSIRQTYAGVTVAIEPWTDEQDVCGVFKSNICEKGILPLRVLIFNEGTSVIRFSTTQAKMFSQERMIPIPTISDSEVTQRVEVDEAAAGAVIVILTGGYGAGIAHAVTDANERKNWESQGSIRKCSMSLATIDPGQAMCGFIFLDCSPKAMRKNRKVPLPLVFQITRMPRNEGLPLSFSIPFSL